MKEKILVGLVSVIGLLAAYGLGDWSVSSQARQGTQVIFARDASDGKSSGALSHFTTLTSRRKIRYPTDQDEDHTLNPPAAANPAIAVFRNDDVKQPSGTTTPNV